MRVRLRRVCHTTSLQPEFVQQCGLVNLKVFMHSQVAFANPWLMMVWIHVPP
jgi:hypothetical protein